MSRLLAAMCECTGALGPGEEGAASSSNVARRPASPRSLLAKEGRAPPADRGCAKLLLDPSDARCPLARPHESSSPPVLAPSVVDDSSWLRRRRGVDGVGRAVRVLLEVVRRAGGRGRADSGGCMPCVGEEEGSGARAKGDEVRAGLCVCRERVGAVL